MISTGYRCPLYDGDADDTNDPLPGTTNSKIAPGRSANVTTPPQLIQGRVEDGGIVEVSRGDDDGQGQAPAVTGEVDLGGQPAAGPAEHLGSRRAGRIFTFVPRCRPFLRAPAACWWSRLTVELTNTVHSTAPTESSRTWISSSSRAQVPSASQQANRSWTVCHGP